MKRPKPMPGCGPYLMIPDTIEKEEKMTADTYDWVNIPATFKDMYARSNQQRLQQAAQQFMYQPSQQYMYGDTMQAQREFSGLAESQKRAAELMRADNEMCAMGSAYNAAAKVKELEAQNTALHDMLKIRTDERDALRRKISASTDEALGNHPYHGPTKDGQSVPDEVHERFHKTIGDVLTGKVIPAARKQMEDALRQAPKEKTPFPIRASNPLLEKGIRLP